MWMTTDEALQAVQLHLTEARYTHTLGVRETAIALAEQYGADCKKAELAAIFHDICKYHDVEKMTQIVTHTLNEPHWAEYGPELLHAPCGAFYVQKECGILDEDIFWAIKSHTTGRAGMGLLEQIVFIADYIEPNRQFPGVEVARQLARESLDKACQVALKQTMHYLLGKNQRIHPETVSAYNFYISEGESAFESTFENGR